MAINHSYTSDNLNQTGRLCAENLQLPVTLNERSVGDHLQMISSQAPQHLPSTIRSIYQIWVLGVGGYAERARLAYLETVLRQLQVSHQIVSVTLGIKADWQNHEQSADKAKADADAGIPRLEAAAKAEELKSRIAKAQREQAEERHKQDDLIQPRAPQSTPEEKRTQKLRELDEEIRRLESRKKCVLEEQLNGRAFDELSSSEQEEYRLDENNYNDRIRRAKERRMDYE